MFKSHTIKKRLKCMQYNEIKWTVLLKKAEAVPTAITYHIILIVRCIFIEGFIWICRVFGTPCNQNPLKAVCVCVYVSACIFLWAYMHVYWSYTNLYRKYMYCTFVIAFTFTSVYRHTYRIVVEMFVFFVNIVEHQPKF